MKTMILTLAVSILLTGCTITPFVRDVQKHDDGKVAIERCDLTVYLAVYGLIAKATDCHTETL